MPISKNIKIEVLSDLYYARFIAIWRPEEASEFETPEEDSRPDQERNIPFILVTTSMFKGRSAVIGPNPIVPSQHPMPIEFLKQQIRHISYMFANEFGIFQPPSKSHAETFLAKMRLGFTKIKELNVNVSPAQGSISLKDFRDSLEQFTDQQLEEIQVMTIGENPEDAQKKGLTGYIHTGSDNVTQQYMSITKLVNVYDIENTGLNIGQLPSDPEDIIDSYAPGTENEPMTQDQIALTEDAIADNDAELAISLTAEQQMEADTLATDVPRPMTRDEMQTETIKRLQAELNKTK